MTGYLPFPLPPPPPPSPAHPVTKAGQTVPERQTVCSCSSVTLTVPTAIASIVSWD